MRPLKLVFQAFGPYAKRIEIPFERLGSNNIYLIAGITGAGKTTIFDAISYALFNTSSTSIRGNLALRSDFASDETESFVELEFLFNGEIYNIRRTPQFQRKKARGEGYTLQQSQAQITLPDGKIIAKQKDVDEFIKKLLKLDASQFSQIALLAQGEFMKLLNSDTQKRMDIFRSIFKTENYSLFQQKLKDEALRYKNELSVISSSILQYISQIQTNDEKLLELRESFLANKIFTSLDEFINLLEYQNKTDKNNLKNIQKELKKNEAENISLQKSQQILTAKIKLQKQKEKLLVDLEKSQKDFDAAQVLYKTLNSKNKKVQEIMAEIQKNDNDYKKSLNIIELEEKNKKNYMLRLEILASLEELKLECANFKLYEYNNLENSLKERQSAFLDIKEKTDALALNYNLNYDIYLKNQAGILASYLRNNEPCPVCGSLSHPKPAGVEKNAPDKDFLDRQKQELEEFNSKLTKIAQECSAFVEKANSKQKEFENFIKLFGIKKSELDLAMIPQKQNFEETIKSKEEELRNLDFSITTTDAQIKILKADIETQDIQLIIKKQNELKAELKSLIGIIEEINSCYDKKNIEINSLKSNLLLLDKQIEGYKKIDIEKYDEISDEISLLEKKSKDLSYCEKALITKCAFNEKVLEEIISCNENYKKLQELYSRYKILADCANGNLAGKPKIEFEHYIQSYYLDMVLFEANKRLSFMTKNQFQLLRKKSFSSLHSKTALELEVMDFHTYKTRSTKTLSGGETFKAALALALGLSDCISNLSGVINIDAMFIDEGFGSLDADSLELAMEVISDLSGSNRLIGIISHIDDLKSKIQNQIIAVKSDNGSDIQINFSN